MKLNRNQVGFALPTVIITSIIMMIVLLSALTAASSVQASLRQSYYERVARNAAESGSVYAAKCLLEGSYVDNTVVTPNKNCQGGTVGGRSDFIVNTNEVKSTFSFTVKSVPGDASTKMATINGKVQFFGKNGWILSRVVESQLKQRFSLEQDDEEIRATQAKWYFGRKAIIDFGTSGRGRSVYRNNQPGPAYAGEGATTVNDRDGNLLFWSDGITIWDKNGGIMPNAVGLRGHFSGVQAVAAFPLDNQDKKFGIVSNNTGGGNPTELYFSVVDMSLNGKLGDVDTSVKNKPLSTQTKYAYEGLGAMPSNRQGEFWAYAYHSANKRITGFRVGANGTVPGSQTSTTTMSPAPRICGGHPGYGTFNFNSDYTKMLLYAGAYTCADATSGRAYIYQTDPKTGVLTLLSSWETNSDTVGAGYSADFSPSEKYVYVTQIYPGRLMRYNVESNNSSTIKNSEWVSPDELTTAPPYYSGYTQNSVYNQSGGQIMRGPDGRMYMADQAYDWGVLNGWIAPNGCKINVINHPDNPDPTEIDLRVGGVSLPNGACSAFGLPQMATVYKPKITLY